MADRNNSRGGPCHSTSPGDVLGEFMISNRISVTSLAKRSGLPLGRVLDILKDKYPLTRSDAKGLSLVTPYGENLWSYISNEYWKCQHMISSSCARGRSRGHRKDGRDGRHRKD